MTLWYRQICKPITDRSGKPQPTPHRKANFGGTSPRPEAERRADLFAPAAELIRTSLRTMVTKRGALSTTSLLAVTVWLGLGR